MAEQDLRRAIDTLTREIIEQEAKTSDLLGERSAVARDLAWSVIKEVYPDAAVATWVIMAPPSRRRPGASYASLTSVQDHELHELFRHETIADPQSGEPVHPGKVLEPRLHELREILWADLDINFQFDDGFAITEAEGETMTEVTLFYDEGN